MNNITGIIKEKFQKIKNNLSQINEKETLSKFSLIMIIFLDIFVLYAIFRGLDEHTSQLSTPDEYIPGLCRNIIIGGDFKDKNKIEELSSLIISSSDDYYERTNQDVSKIHPVCRSCNEKIEKIKKDRDIVALFKLRNKLKAESSDLRESIDELKKSYDTYLLENIARKPTLKESDVGKIKQELNDKTRRVNAILTRLGEIDSDINTNIVINNFWKEINDLRNNNKEKLKSEFNRLESWFPVKKLLMQMAFLLPLLILFYFWNSRSIKKSNGLQTLISSHLLIVAFIPVFIKIIETIYDIIPKKLLKKLIEILLSLKLIAIWHYVVICIAIMVFLFLIYVIQKKLFNKEKLIQKRISKGCCLECGKKIPVNSKACPFCGFIQNTVCDTCGNETYIYGKYCKECGVLLSQEKS